MFGGVGLSYACLSVSGRVTVEVINIGDVMLLAKFGRLAFVVSFCWFMGTVDSREETKFAVELLCKSVTVVKNWIKSFWDSFPLCGILSAGTVVDAEAEVGVVDVV